MSNRDFVIDLETILQPRAFAVALIAFRPICRYFYVSKYDYSNLLTIARGQVWESSSELYALTDEWIKEDEEWLIPQLSSSIYLKDSFSSACLLKFALDNDIIKLAPSGRIAAGYDYFFGDLSGIPDSQTEIAIQRYSLVRSFKVPKHLENSFAEGRIADSRIYTIGSAIRDQSSVISSNRYFCRWLVKNDPSTVAIQPEKRFRSLEKAMMKHPARLRIDDILTILEHRETFDIVTEIMAMCDLEKSIKRCSDVLHP